MTTAHIDQGDIGCLLVRDTARRNKYISQSLDFLFDLRERWQLILGCIIDKLYLISTSLITPIRRRMRIEKPNAQQLFTFRLYLRLKQLFELLPPRHCIPDEAPGRSATRLKVNPPQHHTKKPLKLLLEISKTARILNRCVLWKGGSLVKDA